MRLQVFNAPFGGDCLEGCNGSHTVVGWISEQRKIFKSKYCHYFLN